VVHEKLTAWTLHCGVVISLVREPLGPGVMGQMGSSCVLPSLCPLFDAAREETRTGDGGRGGIRGEKGYETYKRIDVRVTVGGLKVILTVVGDVETRD